MALEREPVSAAAFAGELMAHEAGQVSVGYVCLVTFQTFQKTLESTLSGDHIPWYASLVGSQSDWVDQVLVRQPGSFYLLLP